MSNKETGGPAFPNTDRHGNVEEGQTLRDYFAAKAMQGRLADHTVNMSHVERAEDAYKMADAMLAEREK